MPKAIAMNFVRKSHVQHQKLANVALETLRTDVADIQAQITNQQARWVALASDLRTRWVSRLLSWTDWLNWHLRHVMGFPPSPIRISQSPMTR